MPRSHYRYGGLIRPSYQPSTRSHKMSQVRSLLLAFTLGCFVMYVLLSPLSSASQSLAISKDMLAFSDKQMNVNSNTKNPETQRHDDNLPEGWKSIHVFYGRKENVDQPPRSQKSDTSTLIWHSQVHQDQAVVDLLGDRGYFIDLAANDAVEFSNTLALEQQHGWNGLCIEPNPTYWYGLASHRSCTVVGALVGGPVTTQVKVQFRGVYGGVVGKMDARLANRKQEPPVPTVTRYTAPLTGLLEQFDVPKVIDYISLDVEGAEYMILQHFPWERFQIRVLTIERPSSELKTLLADHGYIFLKDLAWWGETLWAHQSTGFTPDHPKVAKIPFAGK